MEQTQVSSSKMAVILAMFIASEFMVTYGNVNAGRDTWFALLLTVLGTLFLALLYYFLLTIIPQGDLFIALDQAFGKILGKLLITLYIAYGL
nr:GerAB/ArcD/ProY family transporter [Bacilli bacterium]